MTEVLRQLRDRAQRSLPRRAGSGNRLLLRNSGERLARTRLARHAPPLLRRRLGTHARHFLRCVRISRRAPRALLRRLWRVHARARCRMSRALPAAATAWRRLRLVKYRAVQVHPGILHGRAGEGTCRYLVGSLGALLRREEAERARRGGRRGRVRRAGGRASWRGQQCRLGWRRGQRGRGAARGAFARCTVGC